MVENANRIVLVKEFCAVMIPGESILIATWNIELYRSFEQHFVLFDSTYQFFDLINFAVRLQALGLFS